MSASPTASRAPATLSATAMALSGGLAVVFVFAYSTFGSLLALSQAADSVADVLTASVLFWAARVGATPADRSHPHGHHQAEPIAALVVAVLTAVMAVELLRAAADALLGEFRPVMSWPLLVAFASKTLLKAALAATSSVFFRRTKSPALNALYVDARNDALVGLVAVVGYLGARYGSPRLDAWLTVPIACWIAFSGFDLARSNIRIIMGESTDKERYASIATLVSSVPEVRSHHNLIARHHGSLLEVTVHIVLDESLSLREAHAVGERVEALLTGESDIARAVVHIDVEVDN